MTKTGLTGNQLKIIALIAMTLDHVGLYIFPQHLWFRVIGRLAFPIFAYMIAEGCRYTKNRKRYLGLISAVAIVCQIVYFIAMRSVYMCIMVTFSLSVGLIFFLDRFKKSRTILTGIVALLFAVLVYFICICLPELLPETDFRIDYGLFGVLLPVLVYFGRNRIEKLLMFSVGLCLISMGSVWVQWLSLITVPLMALYNGNRGKYKLKYLFYLYYPIHLVVIYFIGSII